MLRQKSIKLLFKGFDEVRKTPVPDAHEFKSREDHVSSQVDLITEFIKQEKQIQSGETWASRFQAMDI